MKSLELASVWVNDLKTDGPSRSSPLAERTSTDVCIIGAGIAGLTAAYHLAKAGRSVIVLEADDIGSGESGRTTAHLTHVVEAELPALIAHHGVETARAVWNGARYALELIREIAATESIDCDLSTVPGYHVSFHDKNELDELAKAATAIGFRSDRKVEGDLPFLTKAALRFPDQGRFHPVKYLRGLARAASSYGAQIYTGSRVASVEPNIDIPKRWRVQLESGCDVECEHAVIATHAPFVNRFGLHTKQASYRSYVVALRVEAGSFPDALIEDTADPYHYLRLQPDGATDLVLIGGEDHKTGFEGDRSGAARFVALRKLARKLGIQGEDAGDWSGQILNPVDQLPFIGRNVLSFDNEWVATGFGGDGMTYGTLAGHMISERIQDRTTPWDGTFAPDRLPALANLRKFFTENKDFPLQLARDRFDAQDGHPRKLGVGEGAIFKVDGKKVAVSRLADGTLEAVSPICPHLGCHVQWNGTEKSWDCPCHGSRFMPTGGLINGPANRDLERVELPPRRTPASTERPQPSAP